LINYNVITVTGLACTCADYSIVNGDGFVEFNTPDSLIKYDLDFTEAYLTQHPHSAIDPMGSDNYWVIGKVIGKKRRDADFPWNPLIEVESWGHLGLIYQIISVIVNSALLVLIVILLIVVFRKKTVPNKT
jgi:hypothetical protein